MFVGALKYYAKYLAEKAKFLGEKAVGNAEGLIVVILNIVTKKLFLRT